MQFAQNVTPIPFAMARAYLRSIRVEVTQRAELPDQHQAIHFWHCIELHTEAKVTVFVELTELEAIRAFQV